MTDEITLTLPLHRPFYRIAHLVLGGLAVRLNVTYEHLEDLQLALAGLLEHRPEDDRDVTVRLRVDGATIAASVGPFAGDEIRRELDEADDGDVGLRRLLATVADRVELRADEAGQWVELTKNVQTVQS